MLQVKATKYDSCTHPPHYNTGLLMGSALKSIGLFTFNFIIHNNNKVKVKNIYIQDL